MAYFYVSQTLLGTALLLLYDRSQVTMVYVLACAENAIDGSMRACAGTDMQVRAIRPVAAGEQLTVAYINLMEPRSIRARLLMESKHFSCACERCSAPLETHPDRFLEVRLGTYLPLPFQQPATKSHELFARPCCSQTAPWSCPGDSTAATRLFSWTVYRQLLSRWCTAAHGAHAGSILDQSTEGISYCLNPYALKGNQTFETINREKRFHTGGEVYSERLRWRLAAGAAGG